MASHTENETEQLIYSSSDENGKKKVTVDAEKKKILFDIEPAVFVYSFYFASSTLFTEQYIYQYISQQNNFTADTNVSFCGNFSLFNDEEDMQERIQKESSYAMLVLTVCTTLPSMLSTLFIGPYCDAFGRKLGLVLPLGGAIFKCTVYTIVIVSGINFWFLLVGCTVEGFTGYLATYYMASFAYSSDVSSTNRRTRKITVVEVGGTVAFALGQMCTGPIINNVGYTYPFIFLALLLTLALVYVLVILQETIGKAPNRNNKSLLRNLCTRENIWICAKIFTINNKSNRRPKLLINIVIFLIMIPMSLAKWDAQTYFLKGKPLCFSSYQVGLFSGGTILVQGLGSMLLVFCWAHRIGDLWVLVVALISGALHMVLFAFVTNLQLLAFVPVLGIFAAVVITVLRAMCSKLVDTNEQGSMFAGIALAEATGHMLGILLFNSVFSASVHSMAGFVFLIMAGTYAVSIILALSQKFIPDKV